MKKKLFLSIAIALGTISASYAQAPYAANSNEELEVIIKNQRIQINDLRQQASELRKIIKDLRDRKVKVDKTIKELVTEALKSRGYELHGDIMESTAHRDSLLSVAKTLDSELQKERKTVKKLNKEISKAEKKEKKNKK